MSTTSNRFSGQKGSVLVQFALMLGVLLGILGVLDLCYMLYAKRDLQRNADLAALHAVQFIGTAAAQSAPQSPCVQGGNDSVQANWLPLNPTVPVSVDVICGQWDPNAYPAPTYFVPSSDSVNAVKVELTGRSPFFFPANLDRTIKVQAIATRGVGKPVAAFSIGSKLVQVGACGQGAAPLEQILTMVGAGNLCASVNSYDGLANASVSASGLLKALGLPLDADLSAGNVNELLALKKVSLGELLDVAATVSGHKEFLDLNAQLLSTLGARLKADALKIEIPLGSGPDGPGIFAGIDAANSDKAAALDVKVKVLDIITAAVGVATTGRGLEVPNLAVSVPGLLDNLIKVRVGITEPPSIAIGGVGASAYNAQVRVHINIDTTGGAIGGLLQLLGTKVKLPIFIDMTRASATIKEVSCRVPAKDSSLKLEVKSALAQVCVGKPDGDPFSTRAPICESIGKETLVSALGLIKIEQKLVIPVLEQPSQWLELKEGDRKTTEENPLLLGSTLSGLLNELTRILGEDLLGASSGGSWTAVQSESAALDMVDYYLGISQPQHPDGALPLSNGAMDPPGAYDVYKLRDRLKKDIDRPKNGKFLLMPWQSSAWDSWMHSLHLAHVSSGGQYGGGNGCWANTPEGWVTSGAAGGAQSVKNFNACVKRELKEALMESPNPTPNYLQQFLSPLTELLQKILDPIGQLLSGPLLNDLLGIGLGKNDVEVISLGCSGANTGQLVY